jgi:hypothetical protein
VASVLVAIRQFQCSSGHTDPQFITDSAVGIASANAQLAFRANVPAHRTGETRIAPIPSRVVTLAADSTESGAEVLVGFAYDPFKAYSC